jgi:hypothetical protein
LDEGLGALLDACGPADPVILFCDHGQIPVKKTWLPNDLLVELGLLRPVPGGGYRTMTSDGAPTGAGPFVAPFIECCGGSAFFYPGDASAGIIEEIRRRLAETEGFHRFLTGEEMAACGRPTLPFGFCPLPGFSVEVKDMAEKGQHGYPPGYGDGQVFYMVRGKGVPPGLSLRGGSLLDIAPIALRLAGDLGWRLDMPGLPPARADLFH